MTDNYYAIRMEKLSRFSGDIAPIVEYFRLNGIMRYYNECGRILDNDEQEVFDSGIAWLVEMYGEAFKEACDIIYDNLIPPFGHDIKSANLMKRGNIVVLTDPVCGDDD